MKVKYLEGLRGFAAFIVVIFHFLGTFYPSSIYGTINNIFTYKKLELIFVSTPLNVMFNGNFAVCIFFVLSGFVLSMKFFETKNEEVIVKSAIKRYFRLVIPVFVSVILFLICFSIFEKTDINILSAVYEGLYGSFFTHEVHYNVVLWTMTFEFFGSFLVFLFCSIFGKSKNRGIFYIIILLVFWKTYYLSFILGLLLCDLYFNKSINLNFQKNKLLKVVTFILALLMGSYPNQLGKMEQSIDINSTIYSFFSRLEGADSFYHSIGAFLILFLLLYSSSLKKIFSTKGFSFLGKISFSMYLTHNIVIFYFSKNLFYYFLENLKFSYFLCFIMTFFISLVPIVLFAVIFTKYVDNQSVIFSNYMYKKYFSSDRQNNKILSLHLKTSLLKIAENIIIFLKSNRNLLALSVIITIFTNSILLIVQPNIFSDNNIKLNFKIEASESIDLQVYYTTFTNKAFEEKESVTKKININAKQTIIELPTPQISKLRLDLGVNPGTLILSDISLAKGNVTNKIKIEDIMNYEKNQIEDMVLGEHGIGISSSLNDPYIVMNTMFGEDIKGMLDAKVIVETFFLSFLILFFLLWCTFKLKRIRAKGL